MADSSALKSFALSLAPPKAAASRSRTRPASGVSPTPLSNAAADGDVITPDAEWGDTVDTSTGSGEPGIISQAGPDVADFGVKFGPPDTALESVSNAADLFDTAFGSTGGFGPSGSFGNSVDSDVTDFFARRGSDAALDGGDDSPAPIGLVGAAPPGAQPPSQPTFDAAFSSSFGAEYSPATCCSDSPNFAFGTEFSASAYSADSSFATFGDQSPPTVSDPVQFEASFDTGIGDDASVAGDFPGTLPAPGSNSVFDDAFGTALAAGNGTPSGRGREGIPAIIGTAGIGASPPMSAGFGDFGGGEAAEWPGLSVMAAEQAAGAQTGTPPVGAPSQGSQIGAVGRSRQSRVDLGGHSLLVAEVVSAQLEGRKLIEYKVRRARRAGTVPGVHNT